MGYVGVTSFPFIGLHFGDETRVLFPGPQHSAVPTLVLRIFDLSSATPVRIQTAAGPTQSSES